MKRSQTHESGDEDAPLSDRETSDSRDRHTEDGAAETEGDEEGDMEHERHGYVVPFEEEWGDCGHDTLPLSARETVPDRIFRLNWPKNRRDKWLEQARQ